MLQNIINIPFMQYVSLDYRRFNMKSQSYLTFTNISQTYMLQETASTAPTITYRKQMIRYVRVYASNALRFSQIVIKSAHDGSNLAYGARIHAGFPSTGKIEPDDFNLERLISNGFNNNTSFYISLVSSADLLSSYIQIDLGTEYNISDISIYQTGADTETNRFTIRTYKSGGVLFTNPALPPPPNTFIIPDGNQFPKTYTYSIKPQVGTQNVRYVRYVNAGTSRIQISELIVIDSNGVNVAYNKIVTSLTGNANVIINGTNSVESSAYISTSSNSNEYVEIDLGG
jgi:hypothetical protein